MAIPTDYIFTPGTCLKKDFYGVLKNALISAGWVSVSSNYATDGDVLISPSNYDDKALIINLLKNASSGDIVTTGYCYGGIRFPTSYTPGSAGVAGTFVRPGTWRPLTIAPISYNYTLPDATIFSYRMYVDKSKIICAIEYSAETNLSPMLFYIGLPDTLYDIEKNNRGAVFATTCYSTAASLIMADSVIGSQADNYYMPVISNLALKNPNNDGKYGISDIYYGNATEGVRGKIDGVLALPATGVLTGDNIMIGSYVYYVINCQSTPYGNSFPSLSLAIRIQ